MTTGAQILENNVNSPHGEARALSHNLTISPGRRRNFSVEASPKYAQRLEILTKKEEMLRLQEEKLEEQEKAL